MARNAASTGCSGSARNVLTHGNDPYKNRPFQMIALVRLSDVISPEEFTAVPRITPSYGQPARLIPGLFQMGVALNLLNH
jgi:hypothetical protein